MELKQIKYDSRYHQGYGAGDGEVITITYECPCGKNEVIYEKDDIPGFRDSSLTCYCSECRDKYQFSRDFRGIQIVEK